MKPAQTKPVDPNTAKPAPKAAIDTDSDAKLRLAAGLLIDSFLQNDSMKDNEQL